MDLAYPGLTDTQDLADLPEVELLVIVQRHDQPFTLRKTRDRIRQAVLEIAVLQVFQRLIRLNAAAGISLFSDGTRILKAEDARTRRILQDLVIFIEGNTHQFSHLDVTRIAPLFVLDLAYSLGDLPGLAMYRARRPVGTPDLVEHGAAYTDSRIGLEAGAL